jgi:hypothetical protein
VFSRLKKKIPAHMKMEIHFDFVGLKDFFLKANECE